LQNVDTQLLVKRYQLFVAMIGATVVQRYGRIVLLRLFCFSDVTARLTFIAKQRIELTEMQFCGLLSCFHILILGIAFRTRDMVGFHIKIHHRANSRARLS